MDSLPHEKIYTKFYGQLPFWGEDNPQGSEEMRLEIRIKSR